MFGMFRKLVFGIWILFGIWDFNAVSGKEKRFFLNQLELTWTLPWFCVPLRRI